MSHHNYNNGSRRQGGQGGYSGQQGQSSSGDYGPQSGPMMGGYPQQGNFYGGQPVYAPAPYMQANSAMMSSTTERFVKGALLGAAAAYVITNPGVQNAVIKGTVKLWSAMQGGVEEVKERFRDAEAEIQAEASSSEG